MNEMNLPKLHSVTDEQWGKIEPIITNKIGNWGGANAHDNRTFVNACLYIIKTNSPWHTLPSEYGKYKAINRRYNRWRNQHVWDNIIAILLNEPDYEWLISEQSTNHDAIPNFTMKWIAMISP